MFRLLLPLLLFVAAITPAQAADFKWLDSDGIVHSLGEYRGKPVLLHLWASWCPPCRSELPELSDWLQAHPGITILPVALDRSPEDVGGFLSQAGIDMPVLMTSTDQAFGMGTRTLPTTIVLAADGSTKQIYIGAQPWRNAKFGDQLLAELRP